MHRMVKIQKFIHFSGSLKFASIIEMKENLWEKVLRGCACESWILMRDLFPRVWSKSGWFLSFVTSGWKMASHFPAVTNYPLRSPICDMMLTTMMMMVCGKSMAWRWGGYHMQQKVGHVLCGFHYRLRPSLLQHVRRQASYQEPQK